MYYYTYLTQINFLQYTNNFSVSPFFKTFFTVNSNYCTKNNIFIAKYEPKPTKYERILETLTKKKQATGIFSPPQAPLKALKTLTVLQLGGKRKATAACFTQS